MQDELVDPRLPKQPKKLASLSRLNGRDSKSRVPEVLYTAEGMCCENRARPASFNFANEQAPKSDPDRDFDNNKGDKFSDNHGWKSMIQKANGDKIKQPIMVSGVARGILSSL